MEEGVCEGWEWAREGVVGEVDDEEVVGVVEEC